MRDGLGKGLGNVMHQSLGVFGAPGISFVSLITIGGLAGWIAGMITRSRHGLLTNILIGVAGSWIGSELAALAHVAVRHTVGHFVAALIGSVALILIFQVVEGRRAY